MDWWPLLRARLLDPSAELGDVFFGQIHNSLKVSQRLCLELANPLTGEVHQPADLFKGDATSLGDIERAGLFKLMHLFTRKIELDGAGACVNARTGSIKFNFPGKEVHELEETCALDVAERGGITLEEVGGLMNLTRERVRQLEAEALTDLQTIVDLTEEDITELGARIE